MSEAREIIHDLNNLFAAHIRFHGITDSTIWPAETMPGTLARKIMHGADPR